MKKIYMAGSGGMLGDAFYEVFRDDFVLQCTDKTATSEWLSVVDFRDFKSYEKSVINFKPDFLFHLGAHTDLEYCETNPDDTYSTNTLAVENAVYIANKLNIPLLYISTAGIFDGSQDTFDDWDTPNPLCHYARSKYAGEKFVEQNSNTYLICRAGWMMGGGPKKDKKFVQKLMSQIKQGASELNIVNDKFGTPTYTVDFARTVKELLNKEYWGLYNLVCQGVTSRIEVAQELLDILNLTATIKINSVTSDFFKEEYFANRPQSERLVNKKLQLRGLDHLIRDWRVCLKEYLDHKYSSYL
ncbi:NAD(P)-dependent oxidoreductase [Gammaproteobacteria bacterium]|jgi:dTDP-4-dehydrorhamnose reductase|nr:NAD(P)-dependent oxidoreductase [Gammaproteobacteria bacterium]